MSTGQKAKAHLYVSGCREAGEPWAWRLQVKVRVRPVDCQGEKLDSNMRPVGNHWEFLSREWTCTVLGKQRHKDLVTG